MLITEFHKYMETSGASERHQNNSLKMVIAFALFIGKDATFDSIKSKEQICSFLDTKIKNQEQDPDKRWITTWNYYLVHLKRFFRWLHNHHNHKCRNEQDDDILESEWITPPFINIKKRKTKRLSPYSESEIWERDELLTVIKYELYKRNKAALSLLWDLDARNHEVTLLKIKHIRLRERYGEGELPHESKTGTGPILLTCSLPYVRDWLNEHPFKNEPNARLICNLLTGGPIKPDSLCTVMKQLRSRILRLLESGSITDDREYQKLDHLIKTKKWNPYCIRHSAITADSDFLPEYALKKKVRWSMNSKQGARYIKTRMGNDLKQKILAENGIFSEQDKVKKPSILNCPRCSLVNVMENKYCSKCSYPLVPSAFDEIKANEDTKFLAIEEKFNNMQLMIEKLITVSTQVQDRKQFNVMAQSLFASGILKSEEQKK
jgi:integrase/recombinase XerD